MQRKDRRDFLRHATAMTALGGAGAWLGNLTAMGEAAAQSAGGDYKALVCIFLHGGNDAHNTVVATDEGSWQLYTTTRDPKVLAQMNGVTVPENTTSIALPKSSLLSISHQNRKGLNTGRTFGLHPQLKRLQQLYTSGAAAIVANVGPLVQPTTKMNMLDQTFELPRKLYSHNDQASTWQSFGPDGETGGWGGRIMDKLASQNGNQAFCSVGVGSNSVWLNGANVMPYLLANDGYNVMGGATGRLLGSAALYKAARLAATGSTRPDLLISDYARVGQRALSAELALMQSVPEAQVAPWGTPGASSPATDPLLRYTDPTTGAVGLNPLALQLQTVARMIAARSHSAVGAKRQVFMVSLGGFDTHNDQLRLHASLLAKLDHAIGYFQTCLGAMPSGDMRAQVTSFTASEFGRAMVNNGDGTDHGWGAHHFVIGGAVAGGEIYGRFPEFMAFDGDGNFFSEQLLTSGVLLPEISLDHLVYTLGRWMGVSATDLVGATPGTGICPNINNFPTASRDIGFMV